MLQVCCLSLLLGVLSSLPKSFYNCSVRCLSLSIRTRICYDWACTASLLSKSFARPARLLPKSFILSMQTFVWDILYWFRIIISSHKWTCTALSFLSFLYLTLCFFFSFAAELQSGIKHLLHLSPSANHNNNPQNHHHHHTCTIRDLPAGLGLRGATRLSQWRNQRHQLCQEAGGKLWQTITRTAAFN